MPEKIDIIKVMEIRNWVKNHKKTFTKRFIRESGAQPNPDKPSCIFMAGLPGAGKTEFTKTIISESKIRVVRIDMDEIAEHIESYRPQEADKFRLGASILQTEIFNRCKKEYYPFIMDGTMSHEITLNCIGACVRKGYHVKVTYIKQDPKLAWRFTKAREKVEKRGISKDGFITSYANTINNLLKLNEYPEVLVDIIIKDKHNKPGERITDIPTNELDKFIKIEYNIKELERLLENE